MSASIEFGIAKNRPSYSDYKAWVTIKGLWEAKEFVCLINGEEVQNVMATLTYKALIADINNGLLESSIIEGLHYFPPRVLLDWAEDNENVFLTAGLKYYMNYDHWNDKSYWTLDEAITLLTTNRCPLPSKIIDSTLENEETSKLARQLYTDIENYVLPQLIINGKNTISKKYIIDWAEQRKIKVADELYNPMRKEHNKLIEIENTYIEDCAYPSDYKEWLNLSSCSVLETCCIFSGFKRHLTIDQLLDYICLRSDDYSEYHGYGKLIDYFKREIVANKSSKSIFREPVSEKHIYTGKVLPLDILQWAIDKGIEIPEELLELYKSEQDNIIHFNKYSSRMDLENQNEIGSKIISSIPFISPTNTENWREDVKMAFTDYYNENNVAPKPKKLCAYIKR
jgi:hypothetical protein